MGKISDKGRIAHLQAEMDLIDRMIAKYDAQKADRQSDIDAILEKAAAKA